MLRPFLSLSILSTPLVVALAPEAAAQTPFPTDKNQRLEELDTEFVVTGRMHLPRHVSTTGLRAMRIKGEGDDATLEVSGELMLKAVTGGVVELEDVWLELRPDCREITLSGCLFKGKGGIRPSPEGPSEAKIVLEKVNSEDTASITIESTKGTLLMDRCFTDGPLVLRGIPKSERAGSSFSLSIFGSQGRSRDKGPRGLLGGLLVEGIKDGTIRTCDIGGPEARFVDNRKLTFDGNNVRADRVEFRASENKKLGGHKITKCDFRTEKLVLSTPPQGTKAERLTLDKCYFKGIEDLETMRAQFLEDFENSESGVVAVLRDVCEEPNGFAGNAE